MKRNNFFSRFIVVTLTAALLLISGSRAIRVSALADPVQAVSPVFDTQIYQLQDYIDNGGLTDPQLDIFYLLAGALVVGQLGAQDAKIISPYPNETNVKEWLINCGIQLYNSVIGLFPSGDYYYSNSTMKAVTADTLKPLVCMLMGDAVVARNYQNLDAFLADHPDTLLIPFNRELQLGVNSVFGIENGTYEWQFSQGDFVSEGFRFATLNPTGTLLSEYNSLLSSLDQPRYLATNNYYLSNGNNGGMGWSDVVLSTDARFDLFINTNNHTVSLVLANGSNSFDCVYIYVYYNQAYSKSNKTFTLNTLSYTPGDFQTYQQIVNWAIETNRGIIQFSDNNSILNYYPKPSDLINRYLVGPTYQTATEVTNTTDLNYDVDNLLYYEQVENDYLLDIIGLISDLTSTTDILTQIKDNLYDLTGIINLNPKFINVSIDLPDLSLIADPPVPVNLNEIAELTDNSYLERVKEHARNAGDIFANYVAFWHNCDSDLVYTMFGAAILVLVGAFVGKWGHS